MFVLKSDLQDDAKPEFEIVLTLDYKQLVLLTRAISEENLSRDKPTCGQDWDVVHLETRLKEILKRANKLFS